MRCDIGVEELIANVVSGIAAPFESGVTPAASGAETSGAVWGAEALAAYSFTASEIATTVTTGRNTMIHRIFIYANLCSGYGRESYRRGTNPVIFDDMRRLAYNLGAGSSKLINGGSSCIVPLCFC